MLLLFGWRRWWVVGGWRGCWWKFGCSRDMMGSIEQEVPCLAVCAVGNTCLLLLEVAVEMFRGSRAAEMAASGAKAYTISTKTTAYHLESACEQCIITPDADGTASLRRPLSTEHGLSVDPSVGQARSP